MHLRTKKLLDRVGEVIALPLWPIGWLILCVFLIWRVVRQLVGATFPADTELLLTKSKVLGRLKAKCFEKLWPEGVLGVFYPDA